MPRLIKEGAKYSFTGKAFHTKKCLGSFNPPGSRFFMEGFQKGETRRVGSDGSM